MRQITFTFGLLLLSISLFSQTKFQINDYPLDNDYTLVEYESLKSIFAEIKSSTIFEFGYTRGGCDYRAHAVYTLLKKRGIKTFKIWHFASSKIFLAGKSSKTHKLLLAVKDHINLSTTSPYYSNCDIKISDMVYWGFHVAPIVLTKRNDNIDTLVIDPALFDEPIYYKDWINTQLQTGASSYFTLLDGSLISFQTESQYVIRPDVYCQDCSGNNIITGIFWSEDYSIQEGLIEKSLSKGKVFVEYYKNEILPLEEELFNFQPNTSQAQQLACKIANMKQIISTESDSNVKRLPESYQAKYKTYTQEAKTVLFGNE